MDTLQNASKLNVCVNKDHVSVRDPNYYVSYSISAANITLEMKIKKEGSNENTDLRTVVGCRNRSVGVEEVHQQ